MAPPYGPKTTSDELVKDLAAEIKGKVVLTTGVTPGGLGGHFVTSIAEAEPSLLILAGRKPEKAQQTADAITSAHPNVKVRVLQLDLGSLAAVREAAATVNSWTDIPYIDVLVNNAGIMAVDYSLNPDGFESQFATNHLGHFLFTNLIINKILAAKEPRVVNISSDAHRFGQIRFRDYNFSNGETYTRWQAYGQSKTANILFTISLANKLGPRLRAYSLHPGVIGTNLANHLDHTQFVELVDVDKYLGNEEAGIPINWKTLPEGAATHVYAAFSPSLKDNNGAYLQDSQIADPWRHTVKPWATSPIEAERLWKLTEKLIGQEFNYPSP